MYSTLELVTDTMIEGMEHVTELNCESILRSVKREYPTFVQHPAYERMCKTAIETGWPALYVADFLKHDFNILHDPDNKCDMFVWVLRECGTSIMFPKNSAWDPTNGKHSIQELKPQIANGSRKAYVYNQEGDSFTEITSDTVDAVAKEFYDIARWFQSNSYEQTTDASFEIVSWDCLWGSLPEEMQEKVKLGGMHKWEELFTKPLDDLDEYTQTLYKELRHSLHMLGFDKAHKIPGASPNGFYDKSYFERLRELYMQELEWLISYAKGASGTAKIHFGRFYKHGTQYIAHFSVTDTGLPDKGTVNFHGQPDSQWKYAGAIVVSEDDGRVSSHH